MGLGEEDVWLVESVNGELPLKLSVAQARFLPGYHRSAVPFLQLAQLKLRVTLGTLVWAVLMYQLQNS